MGTHDLLRSRIIIHSGNYDKIDAVDKCFGGDGCVIGPADLGNQCLCFWEGLFGVGADRGWSGDADQEGVL